MPVRSPLLAVVATVAFLGACGDADDPTKPIASSATTTTTTPVAEAPSSSTASDAGAGAPGSTAQAPATTVRAGATTTAPAGATTTTAPDFPKTRYSSTVSAAKKCVNPGGKQSITVKTLPEIVVTYVTSYSDGETHGNNGGGLSNGEGKYSASFILEPTVPPGTATITVTTSTRDKGPSFAQTTFEVGC